MNDFLSTSNILIKGVLLCENRKEFSIRYLPEHLVNTGIQWNGFDMIKCNDGFEHFFTMLDLFLNSDTADTKCNLLKNDVKCTLIYYEGDLFAIANSTLSKFFVLDRYKNYCQKDVEDLAKKKKREELNSLLETYNYQEHQILKKLEELENYPLNFIVKNFDKE